LTGAATAEKGRRLKDMVRGGMMGAGMGGLGGMSLAGMVNQDIQTQPPTVMQDLGNYVNSLRGG
jgi:hypothetical protein